MRRFLSEIIFLLALLPALAAAGKLPTGVLEKKIDSLFVMASAGELRYRDLVEPAIDSIAALGAGAVPRLIEKYDTKDARERLTINNILVEIGSPAVPVLTASLTLTNPEQVSRICYTLGEIKDSTAVEALLESCGHGDWRVRSSAVGALGKIGDRRADREIADRLADSDEMVRKSAAVACGRIACEPSLAALVHMLGDDFYGARWCAAEALEKFGRRAVQPIADSLDSDNIMLGDLGCVTLGKIGGDFAATLLVGQLTSESSRRRALAVRAIGESRSSLACGAVEILAEIETDPIVRYFIDEVLAQYAAR